MHRPTFIGEGCTFWKLSLRHHQYNFEFDGDDDDDDDGDDVALMMLMMVVLVLLMRKRMRIGSLFYKLNSPIFFFFFPVETTLGPFPESCNPELGLGDAFLP